MTSVDPGLRLYYAARVAEYDRVYAKPERQADLRALRRWLPDRFTGAQLLEVACGTGYWRRYATPTAASCRWSSLYVVPRTS